MQCLETAFELSPDDAASMSVSKSLLDIFHDAVASEVRVFWIKFKYDIIHNITTLQVTSLPDEASEESKVQAEKLKNEGNNLMKSEQFTEALSCYSKY